MISRLRTYESSRDLLSSFLINRHTDFINFEQEFKDLLGFKYGLIFPYARSALFCFLKALGFKNDIITCPAYICKVVPNSIILSKNKVNYIDSSKHHFIPSPQNWDKDISKLSKLSIITPYFGYSVETHECIKQIKKNNRNSLIMYDLCQGYLCPDDKKNELDVDVFMYSMGISKQFSTIFGGFLGFNDKEIYLKVKKTRSEIFKKNHLMLDFYKFFFAILYKAGYSKSFASVTEFLDKKTNFLNFFKKTYFSYESIELPFDGLFHLSNFQSSLGRKNIKKFSDNQVIRNSICLKYEKILSKRNCFVFNSSKSPNWPLYPIAVKNKELIFEIFHKNKVIIGDLMNYSCPELFKIKRFKNSNFWSKSIVNLPCFPNLLISEQKIIFKCLKDVIDKGLIFSVNEI